MKPLAGADQTIVRVEPVVEPVEVQVPPVVVPVEVGHLTVAIRIQPDRTNVQNTVHATTL